ncbi:hypothetical protein [Actinoplanes solisilvae]|uniref:hypothetical protein n=1 Tax=Actinoplanes solisilvae TaxID=2486853 RepID=UPI000FD9C645|nr:hypothetical protein [Actinoplanes solisilvae]
MTDQLHEAFEAHEDNTPDPAVVYAHVLELSKKYKRRRRGAQIAAGGVLGAGLIAGAINLPAFLPANNAGGGGTTGIAAAAPAVSPSSDPEAVFQEQFKAYYAAGYGYDNAQVLAKIWKQNPDNLNRVKAEAGRRLLLGETLPIKPTPDKPVVEETITPQQQKQFTAFFEAGYVWDDAAKLAKIWKLSDAPAAKLEAGKRLLAGQDVPVKPKPANVKAAQEQKNELKRVNAFFGAGYDGEDAVKLAKVWKTNPYQAKIEAGKRLLAGQTLPIQP